MRAVDALSGAEGAHSHGSVASLTQLLSRYTARSKPASEVTLTFVTRVREALAADLVVLRSYSRTAGTRSVVAGEDPALVSALRKSIGLSDAPDFGWFQEHESLLYPGSLSEAVPGWAGGAMERLGMKSAVALRVELGGEVVGMVAALSRCPGALGPGALEFLTALGPPVAMVFEHGRTVSSLKRQTQRTQEVLGLLSALGLHDSIEEIAAPVAARLREMYRADHCAISAFQGGEARLVGFDSIVTAWGAGDIQPTGSVLDMAGMAPSPVVYVIDDFLKDNGPLPPTASALRGQGLRSSVRVRLGPLEHPLGAVTLASREPGRFTEADAEQLAGIVQPLAVTIRYFEGRKEAETRTARLESTNRILTRLGAGGTPEHLARGFLTECRRLVEAECGVVLYFDHEAGRGYELALETDLAMPSPRQVTFDLASMHAARLIEQPIPHIVADIRRAPPLHSTHRQLIEAGLYSVVRAPLIVNDTVRGAVALWGRGTGTFSTDDAEMLNNLTRPLALALEKAAALESLAESELKYRSLVAQAEEMIFLVDATSLRVIEANAYAARVLGYGTHELTGVPISRISGQSADRLIALLARLRDDGELRLSDATYCRRDGATVTVDVVASPVVYGRRAAVLILARDVSEHRAIMDQLVQSQKMESLGTMAGAVAHDFNNLLTTIMGFAGLLKRSSSLEGEERENLALIEEAARRAADLTGRLLSFSRGGLARFGALDLRTVVEDTMELAQPTLHAGITVRIDMPAEPVYVEGDSGQLQQAVTNIVLNARDVMPERGVIDLRMVSAAGRAVLTVMDDGPGMPDDVRLRIFEPFYTTKPAGSGTGLGMAITYGIIQGHHGDITVNSVPGRGTTFVITLPLLDRAAHDLAVDNFNAGEGNLVLVVDDDPMVRRTTSATLAELGYNVVEAPDGATAADIVSARPDRFSAVLLDLVMPGMNGSETFRALTAVRPDLPVVVCTGYAADSHIDTDVKRRIAGLVQKPFTAERLAAALAAAGALPTRPART